MINDYLLKLKVMIICLCYIMTILLFVEKIIVVTLDKCHPVIPYQPMERVHPSFRFLDPAVLRGGGPFLGEETM